MGEWEEGLAAVRVTEDLGGSRREKKKICRTDLGERLRPFDKISGRGKALKLRTDALNGKAVFKRYLSKE